MDNRILHLLKQTAQYFHDRQRQAYLVGGSIRNLLLGEPSTDWDIVTDGDAPTLARGLADTLGGYYAHLHDKASRVVIKEQQEIIIDIAPLIGNTIEDDLRRRDFTLNAIAAPLDKVVHHLDAENTNFQNILIDPLHGAADIAAHRLKAVDSEVFRHDPLRMLRAVRLMMRYQLSMDAWTEGLMIRDAALLPLVAASRIHDELYAILEPDGATDRLRFLDAHGLLTVLIPEFVPARGMRQPPPHRWDVLEHSLEAVGALERLAMTLRRDLGTPPPTSNIPTVRRGEGGREAWGGPLRQEVWETSSPAGEVGMGTIPPSEDLTEISTLLLEAEQQGIFQFANLTSPRMKMAALLHDIGKPATYTIDEAGAIHFYNHPQAGVPLAQHVMTRLSASTQDRRLVQQVVAHHMRPGQLGQNDTITPRAIRRYFVDLGPTGIYVALISLADHLATLGPQPLSTSWTQHLATVRLLLTGYIRERASILPPRLLSPEELMRRLSLQPGPLVGQLLESIAEAQAEGRIHSKEEALWLAEEQLEK